MKILSPQEAVALIRTGDTIAINGFGSISHPEEFDIALAERFRNTGEPRDLNLVFAAGQGVGNEESVIDRISHEGLIKKVISGHWIAMLKLNKMALENKIEAYNLPQGVISHLFRAAAGRKPGIITKIGLNTVIDPRHSGGRLNSVSNDELVKLMAIDGEEYLFYKSPQLNVALIRGTTADPKGNITMEKEAAFLEALSIAQAVKANKGIVMVQVERLSSLPAHPQQIKVPGILVDVVVISPNQKQTLIENYNPSYSGEIRLSEKGIENQLKEIQTLNQAELSGKERGLAQYIVARRAACEIEKNAVVNLGVGIPELLGYATKEKGIFDQITLTVESGTIGGIPSSGGSFGAAINPDAIIDQPYQFDFYDGGGLDIAFMGAMEIDRKGNVNVSRIGSRIVGVGGFINITQSTKKVVFCFNFTSGGLEVEFVNGQLRIVSEGCFSKIKEVTEEISFSSEFANNAGQEVLFVTERCVFRLVQEGLELIEIAPGINLYTDIMEKLTFKPQVSNQLILMDSKCFEKLPEMDSAMTDVPRKIS